MNNADSNSNKGRVKRVCLAMGNIGDGGIGTVFLGLAQGFLCHGVEVDFVFISKGSTTNRESLIPRDAKVFKISNNSWLSIPGLVHYFRSRKPDAVISAVAEVDINVILAHHISGIGKKCQIICTFHTHMTTQLKQAGAKSKIKVWLAERLYRLADHLVAVSLGVSRDIESRLALPNGSVKTIYNPIWSIEKEKIAELACDYDWLVNGFCPVIIAAGRLTLQKNFPNLLRAFALVRKVTSLRLLILGEGELREELESLILELGIQDDVRLLGFIANPLAYFKHSDVFVLSSDWEGLPTVLIEALGCGLPIVATDCKSGPDEILAGGRYGELVPVNDSEALAKAITKILAAPPDREFLKTRAQFFTPTKITAEYLALIN